MTEKSLWHCSFNLQYILCFTARKHGLTDVSQEVLSLVSHATQERLRNILEKMSTVSLHRLEVYRVCKATCSVIYFIPLKLFIKSVVTGTLYYWPTHIVPIEVLMWHFFVLKKTEQAWWSHLHVQPKKAVKLNEQYHRKMLLTSFYLKGHTKGCHPQTQKRESSCTA